MYLFRYYNAVSLILKGHHKKADEIFDELFVETNNETTNGELLYHWALVKSALDQSGHAIHFGRLALQIFMNQHNFYRILHTLMLLGISYTNSKVYEEAHVCFNHLIRNAELLKEERMLPQIYHNMGYLQDKMDNVKEALTYYEKSLSLQPLKNQNYLVTLYGIGEINYKLSDIADFYLIHIDSPEKAMKYLEVKVIPYLEGSKEHKEDMIRYYRLLSEHYNQQEKYLEAVNYLSKII
jgi:tetratricopeptide (TPR) repeat protein